MRIWAIRVLCVQDAPGAWPDDGYRLQNDNAQAWSSQDNLPDVYIMDMRNIRRSQETRLRADSRSRSNAALLPFISRSPGAPPAGVRTRTYRSRDRSRLLLACYFPGRGRFEGSASVRGSRPRRPAYRIEQTTQMLRSDLLVVTRTDRVALHVSPDTMVRLPLVSRGLLPELACPPQSGGDWTDCCNSTSSICPSPLHR